MKEFNEFGPFAVGEVCVIVNATYRPDFNGKQVTIRSMVSGSNYEIDLPNPNGGFWRAYEHNLRRRKPPTTGEDLILAIIKDAPDTVNRRVPVAPHMASYDLLHAAIAVDGMVQRIEQSIVRGAA